MFPICLGDRKLIATVSAALSRNPNVDPLDTFRLYKQTIVKTAAHLFQLNPFLVRVDLNSDIFSRANPPGSASFKRATVVSKRERSDKIAARCTAVTASTPEANKYLPPSLIAVNPLNPDASPPPKVARDSVSNSRARVRGLVQTLGAHCSNVLRSPVRIIATHNASRRRTEGIERPSGNDGESPDFLYSRLIAISRRRVCFMPRLAARAPAHA